MRIVHSDSHSRDSAGPRSGKAWDCEGLAVWSWSGTRLGIPMITTHARKPSYRALEREGEPATGELLAPQVGHDEQRNGPPILGSRCRKTRTSNSHRMIDDGRVVPMHMVRWLGDGVDLAGTVELHPTGSQGRVPGFGPTRPAPKAIPGPKCNGNGHRRQPTMRRGRGSSPARNRHPGPPPEVPTGKSRHAGITAEHAIWRGTGPKGWAHNVGTTCGKWKMPSDRSPP